MTEDAQSTPLIPEKVDLDVIFSEDKVKYGDKEYLIKPWTLRQLTKAWPLLLVAFDKFKLPEGVDISNLGSLLLEKPKEFLDSIMPYLEDLLSISLKIDKEEAGEIEVGLASILILKVLSKNMTHLKNFLSLTMKEAVNMAEALTITQ